MADKKAYHPNGSAFIEFLEGPHSYIDNMGVRYLSGTSFCGQFFPKFDAKTMSKKCAAGKNPKYAGRHPDDILAEWQAEAERGSSEGDNTHMYAEGLISGWPREQLPSPISDRCRALFVQVVRAVTWLLKRFVFVAAEMVIFSPDLGLSGMVDLVMFDPKTETVLIFDWKTNKKIPSPVNPYQKGFPPVDHLQDTAISHYSMQLSLYRKIMEKEQYFPGQCKFNQALIHLSPEKYTVIQLEYYEYEIDKTLEYHEINSKNAS